MLGAGRLWLCGLSVWLLVQCRSPEAAVPAQRASQVLLHRVVLGPVAC